MFICNRYSIGGSGLVEVGFGPLLPRHIYQEEMNKARTGPARPPGPGFRLTFPIHIPAGTWVIQYGTARLEISVSSFLDTGVCTDVGIDGRIKWDGRQRTQSQRNLNLRLQIIIVFT